MARDKISEFRAKNIVYSTLGMSYGGFEVDLQSASYGSGLADLRDDLSYVVKVDQAIKKRNKLGLVFVDVPKKLITEKLEYIKNQGFRWALVEPYIIHNTKDEKYFSIELAKDGFRVLYSDDGGVDIEDTKNNLQSVLIKRGSYLIDEIPYANLWNKLIDTFEQAHLTNLEINPFIIVDEKLVPLDAAVQVDGVTQFLVDDVWVEDDIRVSRASTHKAEVAVQKLASKSSSSLNLKVLNENGSIFMLLSGGGASVVISDELAEANLQKEVANYGEYSGNPNEEETYLYAKQIIKLLLGSSAPKKVLLIAGGVANFTDVSATFRGIIRALDDDRQKLSKQKLSVVVRRGGPNERKGLASMKEYLERNSIDNIVFGSDHSLADVVIEIQKGLDR